MIRIISILLFLVSLISAQNYNDAYRLSQQTIELDAKTMSLGNSTIASLGSFSSTLINPAGLGTIKKDIFSISFNSNLYKNNSQLFNTSMESDDKSSNVNQISLVIPLPVRRGSAVLAFGYLKVKDFFGRYEFNAFNSGSNSMIQDLTNSTFVADREFAWELGLNSLQDENSTNYNTSVNGRLNENGDIFEKGSLNNWLMSGAVEIAKNLFVGATFNIISGDYYKNRNYYEMDSQNNYNGLLDPNDENTNDFESFYLNDNIEWDINGWDLRLGLLYNLDNFLNFGATIKLPSTYSIEEKYSIFGKSIFADNEFRADYPGDWINYKFTTPMEFSGGISASLPFVMLNASAKLVDYSQLEYTDGFSDEELNYKNNQIDDVFESTVNFNLGAEFTLPYPALKIRAGFMYLPSPYKGDDAEFDKKYLTAGVGFPLSKQFIVDLAYVHGWWKNFSDNYGTDVSRVFQDIKTNYYVVSASYAFM